MNRNDPHCHVTRPRISHTDTHVLVLCGHGHLIDSMRLAEWAHSAAEARYSDPSCTVECMGALPT